MKRGLYLIYHFRGIWNSKSSQRMTWGCLIKGSGDFSFNTSSLLGIENRIIFYLWHRVLYWFPIAWEKCLCPQRPAFGALPCTILWAALGSANLTILNQLPLSPYPIPHWTASHVSQGPGISLSKPSTPFLASKGTGMSFLSEINANMILFSSSMCPNMPKSMC